MKREGMAKQLERFYFLFFKKMNGYPIIERKNI